MLFDSSHKLLYTVFLKYQVGLMLRSACYMPYVIVLLICISPSYALKVFPTITELGDSYSNRQSFILTVLNDGPKTEDIILMLDPDSSYMQSYVSIDPVSFSIKSNGKQNVRISTSFPKNLSPETHQVVIIPMTSDGAQEQAVYSFSVPGIAKPNLEIADITIENIGSDDGLVISIQLNNLGNVIARGVPHLSVMNGSKEMGSLRYESKVMVMPFNKYNISLMYDVSDLAPGNYTARLYFQYNNNLTTPPFEKDFEIRSQQQKSERSFQWLWFLLVIPIGGLVAYLVLKPESLKKIIPDSKKYPKNIVVKVNELTEKQERIDKDLHELFDKTNLFVTESNEWMKTKFNGKYQFK